MKSFSPVAFACVSMVGAIFIWGCAEMDEEGVFAGGAGPAVGGGVIRSSSGQTAAARGVGVDTGAAVSSAVRIIARYEATPKQREVAVRRAERVYRQMPVEKKQALKKEKVTHLVVDTEPDERAKGEKSVMVWDIEKEEIVGNVVYDVAPAPPQDEVFTFDSFRAEYIGESI